MHLIERLDEFLVWVITALIGTIATGISWLVRRVVTNQKQIEMLQTELDRREKLRTEDRERMSRVENGVSRIENWLIEADINRALLTRGRTSIDVQNEN